MLEKYSYAITIILLISSVVSPIITAIINNNHQRAMKELDMYENAKRQVLSNFVKTCEDFILEGKIVSNTTWSAFYSSIHQLFIYFDISDYSMFTNLEDIIRKLNIFDSNRELTKIVQVLSKQIKKV